MAKLSTGSWPERTGSTSAAGTVVWTTELRALPSDPDARRSRGATNDARRTSERPDREANGSAVAARWSSRGRLALVLLGFLLFCAGAPPWATGADPSTSSTSRAGEVTPAGVTATNEPPLILFLETGGRTVPVAVDQPFPVDALQGGAPAALRLAPHREFQFGGLSFHYPRDFTFEVEPGDGGLLTWTLSGRDVSLILQWCPGAEDPVEFVTFRGFDEGYFRHPWMRLCRVVRVTGAEFVPAQSRAESLEGRSW